MNINLQKLKALAQAAQGNPYNAEAGHDYGMAMPPAVALELIAEIERHRPLNAEGCKPEISIQPASSTAGGAVTHDLNKAEGEQPDFNSPIHPDDMPAIVDQHREFMKLTNLDWMDEASSLQDQAYALGHHRGQTAVIPAASLVGLPDVLPAVAVEGDQLVIRITTECLLHAVTCAPEWPINDDGSPTQINDGALLVKEIIDELQRENEHGTNQMHRMFDEAAVSALDNGSQAVSYDSEAQQ
ncbi:hypothetical protein [Pseudomonas japonica]|uniref:hypothetical protein n=1 Tax=Pseudomonas japonica TaxID=256466 RepID=UPI003A886FE7